MNPSGKHELHLTDVSWKARFYLALALFIPFAMIFIYVWTTAADVVFRDDIWMIKGGFIESYCQGNLSLADLWRPAAKTRTLGYNFLQVANIKWFGLNTRIMVLLIPFLMLGSALLIYRDYRKSLLPQRSPEFVAVSFVLLSLVIFNVVQWEGLTFGYGFVFQSPVPFFIASFISLELFLTRGKPQYWPAAFILPALAVLVFGGSHAFSFAPALGVTFVCYVLTRRASLTKDFWLRVLFISVFLAVLAFLYMHDIHHNDYFPDASHHVDKVLERPLDALQFFLAAFGASVIGADAVHAHFSFPVMVALGLCVVMLYGVGVYLFVRSRLYERTYLPFYLLMQSFFYLVFMMMGRFGYGIDYGMASRYTCVSIYGLVALVWVFIFVLASGEAAKTKWRGLLYVPLVMIFAGILLTAMVEWRIQPHRKVYFKNLHDIALRVDTATDKELSKFENSPALVRESLMVLREHRLNVYRTLPLNRK